MLEFTGSVEFQDEIVTIKRVSKRVARRLFCGGEKVYLLPCKVNPNNCWCYPSLVNEDFDKFVNAFEYYNCGVETGRYASFYIRVGGSPTTP